MDYIYNTEGHTFIRREGAEPDGYKVIAAPSQFPLIAQLYRSHPVQVCSRQYMQNWSVDLPGEVFEQMQQVSAASEHGGWRRLERGEYTALELTQFHSLNLLSPAGQAVFMEHPAVLKGLLLPFSGLLPLTLFYPLVNLYDIRRFTDPAHPTRLARLKSYFKLTNPASTLKLVAGASQRSSDALQRTACLLDAWYTPPFNMMSPEAARKAPEAFLMRYYHEQHEIFKRENARIAHGMALWRTTLRFLEYVRLTWLAGIEAIEFKPELFFTLESEVEAYFTHIKNIDKNLDNSFTND